MTQTNQSSSLQSILIVTLVSGMALAALTFFQLLYPIFGWFWLSIPLAVVMFEAVLTASWMRDADQRHLNKWRYRVVEIFLIMVLARIVVWTVSGNWPNGETWIDFVRNPIMLIVDGLFWVSTLLLLFCWERTVTYCTLFQDMALDQAELAYIALPRRERERQERPRFSTRGVLLEQFGTHWIIGAGVMAILAAASTIEYTDFTTTTFRNLLRLPMPGGMLVALLLYFGAGLALLSRGRLAVLNATWMHGGLRKTEGIDRSWHRSTLWLLLGIGGVAAFLPIGSTSLIARLITLVIFWVLQLVALLSFLFFLLFSFLFPNASSEMESVPAEPVEPPPLLQPPPAEVPTEPGFPLFGTIFWIALAVVIVLALLFFLQNRSLRLPLPFRLVWDRFTAWWRSVWRVARLSVIDLRDAMVTRLVRDDEVGFDAARPWRFVRLNALTPRQKLRYFYLSTVRRAEERGLEREESETPIEYAGDLKAGWPQADQQVDQVTAGFLKARYSQTEISEDDVEAVQAEWKALRRKLKRRKGKNKGEIGKDKG